MGFSNFAAATSEIYETVDPQPAESEAEIDPNIQLGFYDYACRGIELHTKRYGEAQLKENILGFVKQLPNLLYAIMYRNQAKMALIPIFPDPYLLQNGTSALHFAVSLGLLHVK